MSLINQMLRDLEQRLPSDTATLPQITPVVAEKTLSARRWPWGVAVLASLTGLGYVVVNIWMQTPITQVLPALPATHTAVVAAPPVDVSAVPPETSSRSVVEPEQVKPIASPTPVPDRDASAPSQDPALVVEPLTKPVKTSTPKLATPKKTKPAPVNVSPVPSSPSLAVQIERLRQQADDAASLTMRKEIFKELLALAPHDLKTRDQLLAILLKTASVAEQESFLRDSLMLYPNHLAFVTSLARLQLQQKNAVAASATLERAEAAGSGDIAYVSLLAASYQQQKRFREAAPLYQTLTRLQPEKAEHWLGLGICADNLQQAQTAVQAYQRALEPQTLNGDVTLYIQQRLAALN